MGRKPQSKLMSRRTERPYQVDGAGKLARHSAARCSVPEIKGPVVQQEFTSLLRETCNPDLPATAGTAASNDRRAGADLSGEGIENQGSAGAAVIYDSGWFDGFTFHPWTGVQ